MKELEDVFVKLRSLMQAHSKPATGHFEYLSRKGTDPSAWESLTALSTLAGLIAAGQKDVTVRPSAPVSVPGQSSESGERGAPLPVVPGAKEGLQRNPSPVRSNLSPPISNLSAIQIKLADLLETNTPGAYSRGSVDPREIAKEVKKAMGFVGQSGYLGLDDSQMAYSM